MIATIHSIINTCKVLHVSFPPASSSSPFPALLPMIGAMGSFDHPSSDLNDPLDCYLHGYISSRLMNLARSSSSSSSSSSAITSDSSNQTTETKEQGLPVTIAATKVDGLVLSLTPFSHSYNYRSAILFGRAVPVTDPEEKLYAMRLITESVVPSRWESCRTPPDAGEMGATGILKVQIEGGSGKVRTGPPKDDKKDMKGGQGERVWTGVVPVWETMGEPMAGGAGGEGETLGNLGIWVREENHGMEAYAKMAAAGDKV
ncbi:MAG: hypothetical protein Q9167_004239 [Letrouitia subvulpina]